MKRRSFLATAASASAAVTASGVSLAPAVAAEQHAAKKPSSVPSTGARVPALAGFDQFMSDFLTRFNIPGGQLAVAKDGHQVYSRGFGHVDRKVANQSPPPPVEPTAIFRLASSSKSLTAVAVMALVQAGQLTLNQSAFEILHDLTPPPGKHVDPRVKSITVRQLLEHSGGLVDKPFDVQFDGLRLAADAFKHPRPATNVDLIRYQLGRPLGFEPGTSYAYSNVGYNALGRIIERITKKPYGEAVKELVLVPLQIHGMAVMTRTSPSSRLPNEVFYDDGLPDVTSYSIYEDDLEVRRYAYGGYDGSAIDAHGGWIAGAPDLVRFLNGVGGKTGKQILAPETVQTMLARPNNPFWHGKDKYYALGWNVVPGKVTMTHNGAITYATCSMIARLTGDVTVAACFNHLDPDLGAMLGGLGDGIMAAANAVARWPG